MSSYNYGKYLSKAIESVLNQSHQDLELIIVDDFSRDNSQEIIESYQARDHRIRSIFHIENMGMSKSLNDGISSAKGEFVALLDSDDIWVNTKIEKQLKILEENQDLIVWSEGEIIDEYDTPLGTTFTQKHNASKRKKSGNIFEELLCGNFIFGSSIIFKKQNLPANGFNERLKYLSDYQFVVDLAKKYDFYFIEESLAKYRIHGKNAIFNDRQEDWQRDRTTLYQYFINEYGSEITLKVKSSILIRMGLACSKLGERRHALLCICSSIMMNPFSRNNLNYLTFALKERIKLLTK
jgi:glycosyltransferase involved in cell wall biosynthesis